MPDGSSIPRYKHQPRGRAPHFQLHRSVLRGSPQRVRRNRVRKTNVRKVIVFGGSAGGIQSLCNILSGLPARFQAAVLAVIHTSETSTHLPEVLGRCCHLRVVSPARPEPISGGNLYIAQPNRHLIVKSHCAVSWLGPARESSSSRGGHALPQRGEGLPKSGDRRRSFRRAR
jgi:Chemotaxis response regulator containing a CheY-like receiver domain and a methylesterase domain